MNAESKYIISEVDIFLLLAFLVVSLLKLLKIISVFGLLYYQSIKKKKKKEYFFRDFRMAWYHSRPVSTTTVYFLIGYSLSVGSCLNIQSEQSSHEQHYKITREFRILKLDTTKYHLLSQLR